MVRFFGGLHTSLDSGVWKPDGVPTIYKVMEGLDNSDFDVEFVLSNYNLFKSSKFCKFYVKRNIKNFKSNFHVLNVFSNKNNFVRKIKNFIFIIKKFFFIVRIIKKFKPDLVYVDRAHIIEGALIKTFFKCKVFVRMMGVAVYKYNDILSGKSFYSKLSRWAFKNKFDHFLFSEDGSDINDFKKEYLKEGISSSTLFNGVKKRITNLKYRRFIQNKFKGKLKILFVSRLETNKKCDLFINSVLNLNHALKKKIVIIIAGSGSELDNLKSLVKKNKSQKLVNFIGSINHDDINILYDTSDIFVSLNTTGNLSNNCLEAFNSGICCIIPEENYLNGCDKIIKEYVGKNSIIRVPYENMHVKLTYILTDLIKNRKKIKVYANNIKKDSKSFLRSWNSRVKNEIILIDKIIKKN